MARTYHLASAAVRDLIEILDYTSRQWGVVQADKYARDLEDCLMALVEGRVRAKPFYVDSINFLIWRCKSHYIFFFEQAEWVDVFAILHTSMDLVTHLQDRLGDC